MITQYDLNDNKIRDYDSMKEAREICGFARGINDCINGKRDTYKGYKWKLQT